MLPNLRQRYDALDFFSLSVSVSFAVMSYKRQDSSTFIIEQTKDRNLGRQGPGIDNIA
jgi:hypothetical protein